MKRLPAGAAFVIALACGVAAARAQDAPLADNPFQRLDDCVSAQALRLEPSGESADIVASAAVAKCNRELTAAAESGASGFRIAAARTQLKDSMRETALVQIVELRAARHAPPPPSPAVKPPSKPKKKPNP